MTACRGAHRRFVALPGRGRRHLSDPVRVELGRKALASPESLLVRQTAYMTPRGYKPAALMRVLDLETPAAAIVEKFWVKRESA